MMEALRERGLFYLHRIADPVKSNIFTQGWVSAENLGSMDKEVWENYCHSLKNSHVRIKYEEDKLVWSRNPVRAGYTPKLGYKALRKEGSMIWTGGSKRCENLNTPLNQEFSCGWSSTKKFLHETICRRGIGMVQVDSLYANPPRKIYLICLYIVLIL
jgi:hypothetical protein